MTGLALAEYLYATLNKHEVMLLLDYFQNLLCTVAATREMCGADENGTVQTFTGQKMFRKFLMWRYQSGSKVKFVSLNNQ